MTNAKLLSAWTFLLMTGSAGAVNCLNNIPASNPDSIYTVHGDGTVTNTRTGLMWKVCAEGQTWNAGACTGTEAIFTWDAALAQAEASTFVGHSDWRLPSLKELRNLVEECRFNPSINDTVFSGASSSHFWSGSPDASNSNYALVVYFYDGHAYGNGRYNDGSVRLVRGGTTSSGAVTSFSVPAISSSGVSFAVPQGSSSCRFAATGTYSFCTGSAICYMGPEGIVPAEYGSNRISPTLPAGCLFMRSSVGDTYIGTNATVAVQGESSVLFIVNDIIGGFGDNGGSATVSYSCQ
jgi:hypothetical protein